MSQQKKPLSLQDILRHRQRSDFVGREEQITLFRQNLALPLDDDRRRFIFNVSGQGGVGGQNLAPAPVPSGSGQCRTSLLVLLA